MVRPARKQRRTKALAASAAAVIAAGQHSAVEAFQPSSPQHLLVASDAPPLSHSQSRHLYAGRNNHYYKQRGVASPLAVAASHASGDSAENNSSADLQNIARNTAENALSTLSSAADQVQQSANDWTDEYVDDYEVEQEELSKRRAKAAQQAAERRRMYEITVPLTTTSTSTGGSTTDTAAGTMVGLTLRQIASSGEISAQALDFDAASIISDLSTEEELDPTMREGEGGSVEILPALLQSDDANTSGSSKKSRGGRGGGSRVIVSSVVRDGAAWIAGVRPGDVVLATSATVGQVRIVPTA